MWPDDDLLCGPIIYTVEVSFTEPGLAEGWLRWLQGGHIADVLAGGASSAEVVELDARL